jgi:hypothetical protein
MPPSWVSSCDCRECSFYGYNGVITKRSTLPDFGKFFRTNSRSPINFVCRDAPNLLHDMVFLRSYLHDATFEIGKIHRTGNLLRIPLQRDRWERYKPSRTLEKIASSLVISPVLGLKWESMSKPGGKQKARHSNSFYIRDIYLAESYWDNTGQAEIVLAGFGAKPSKLRVLVRDPFSIRLTDVVRKPREQA